MQVTFGDDALSIMNTNMQTAEKGYVTDPVGIVVIGNDGWGGTITSGGLQSQVGASQGSYIVWKDFGKESTRALWQMDDETAVLAGLASIAEALQGDEMAITLYSDGSYSVAS
jgi:hypothetical protein